MFLIVTILVFLFVCCTSIFRDIRYCHALIFTYIIFLTFMIIFIYFLFSSSAKERKIDKSRKELKELSEYTANIESMYMDINSIRHDYANAISSIIGYIQDDDMEGLKKYFHEKIIPFLSSAETVYANFSVLSNIKEPSLKGIVAVKLIHAQENNIPVVIDIKNDIHIKSVKVLDLNRVIGILLDNACEAAIECDAPYINVGFVRNSNVISIIVVNSIKDKHVNMGKIFEQGFSTKGENRGYGLSNVRCILGKYPNVLLDTLVEDNEFRQIVHIEEGEGNLC